MELQRNLIERITRKKLESEKELLGRGGS